MGSGSRACSRKFSRHGLMIISCQKKVVSSLHKRPRKTVTLIMKIARFCIALFSGLHKLTELYMYVVFGFVKFKISGLCACFQSD